MRRGLLGPSRRREASRGLIGSLLSASTGLISTLVLMPVALEGLGSERYGLWVLLWQLTGYLNLLDLGIAYAASRDLAAAHAARNRRLVEETVATGFYLYAGLGLAFFGIGWVLLPLVPHLSHGARETATLARWPLLLLLTHGIIAFPARFLASANIGAQAVAASGVVSFVQGLVNVITATLMLRSGVGLSSLPAAIVMSDLIALALHSGVFSRLYGLRVLMLSNVRAAAIRRLVGFSVPVFVAGLGWTIVAGTDAVVVSARLGLTAAAFFAVSYRIPSQLVQLVNLGADVTLPGLTGIMTAESWGRRSHAYAELLRLVGAAAGLCAAAVLVLLRPFMYLWVGPQPRPDLAFVAIMAYLVVHHPIQHVLALAMTAARDVRVFAAVAVAEAAANLGLSLAAVGLFGVPGVLYATALAGWINVGYGLWKSSRLTGLRPAATFGFAFGHAAAVTAVGFGAGLVTQVLGLTASWGRFLLGSGAWVVMTVLGLAILDQALYHGQLRSSVGSLLVALRPPRTAVPPVAEDRRTFSPVRRASIVP
ncbi:MAG: lipopolysaccharide biosynthesis protein [Armatimonadota bacterium]|nr:lipopolysaccharide biosynthesis protein [Armatimonadota bacterium]